ncbi:MAG TPA: dolichyl-phosphate beta-glucosyltransferase [Mycobacteriales bacterium]|jgi:putative flippase GtrA|nr:dolichyl-phosphate beta-glucosyltransferase [Mycobacteriales bacterium]
MTHPDISTADITTADVTSPADGGIQSDRPTTVPAIDIVVPVYNEAAGLQRSIMRLHDFLEDGFPLSWRITIVDNASTDHTWPLACQLARELDGVRVLRLAEKGRGRALRAAWASSDSPVLAYMDVDLSTDLSGLLPLVAPLLSEHSDVAIGTRLARDSRVSRGAKRELISRCYNVLLRGALAARFSDAQCGFKAIRADHARALLPTVRDQEWFFDTELLVRAQRRGLRIHEVPVDWVDDPDSRVDIIPTALADLRGVARLLAERRRGPLGQQLVRFTAIGITSTLAYLALYLVLRTAVPAVVANAVALAVTAVANTAANRHFTFGIRDKQGQLRHQLQGIGVFATALAVTTAAIGLLHLTDPHPPRWLEAAVLVVANLGATALRFLLLRGWVFAGTTTAARS